jgi:hypothetical protein
MQKTEEKSIEELVDEEIDNLNNYIPLKNKIIDDRYIQVVDLRESFGGFFEELFRQEPIAWIGEDGKITKDFNEHVPEGYTQLPLYDSLTWFELMDKWFSDAFEEEKEAEVTPVINPHERIKKGVKK